MFSRTLVLILILVFAVSVDAKQTSFRKYNYGNDIVFTYKFRDYLKRNHNISFTLTEKDVPEDIRRFEKLDGRRMNNEVLSNLKYYAEEAFPDVTIKIKRVGKSIRINASGYSNGRVQQALAYIKQEEERAKDQLLEEYFYTKDKTGHYILPDHPRIAQNFIHFSYPIAQAISDYLGDATDREKIDFTLAFLQNVPYDKLQSRQTSNGAGFATPLDLYKKNRGDCDSKSVAFAAIMRSLLPSADMIMVYIPGHAFAGIAIPPEEGDNTIQLEGKTFVLVEPVGPGLLPVGFVSKQSLQALRKGNFTFKYF